MGAVSSTQIALAAVGAALTFSGVCIAAYNLYLKIGENRGAARRDVEMTQVETQEVHDVRGAIVAAARYGEAPIGAFTSPYTPQASEGDEFYSMNGAETSSASSLRGEQERGSSVETIQSRVVSARMEVQGGSALVTGDTALPVNGAP